MTEPGQSVTVPERAPVSLTRPATNPSLGMWSTNENFALAQRAATALAASDLVPEAYKGKAANCLIALDISSHLGISPLTVMQNLHLIHGRPSWGSPFIIGSLNSCGRFSPLRFTMTKRGKKRVEITTWTGPKGNRTPTRGAVEIEDTECFAYATELATGERIDGPVVSIEMATIEGWVDKAESKWKSMPELMLKYRAAAFFGRLYAPDTLMGMHTVEEVLDGDPPAVTATARVASAGAASLQDALDATGGAKAAAPPPAAPATPPDAAPPPATAPAAEPESPEPAKVAEPPSRPVPSRFAQRAIEKRAKGGKLTQEESESIRDFELDLGEYDRLNGVKSE
jgi:hypothetical protein